MVQRTEKGKCRKVLFYFVIPLSIIASTVVNFGMLAFGWFADDETDVYYFRLAFICYVAAMATIATLCTCLNKFSRHSHPERIPDGELIRPYGSNILFWLIGEENCYERERPPTNPKASSRHTRSASCPEVTSSPPAAIITDRSVPTSLSYNPNGDVRSFSIVTVNCTPQPILRDLLASPV